MNIANMNLIGSGAEADIYLYEGKAIKIFNHQRSLAAVYNEADLQKKAHDTGLPVPKIYEVSEIDGKPAITMEYVKGTPLGSLILENMDKASLYLEVSVDLQRRVHSVTAAGFPGQHEKLEHNIMSAEYLTAGQKNELLHLLQNLKTDSVLCHGDFHVLNLLQTDNDIKIIDWVCASKGSLPADVCRSYLLYRLYMPEIAQTYLELYCSKSELTKHEVLLWLPVVAGARLHENVTKEDVSLLLTMIDLY